MRGIHQAVDILVRNGAIGVEPLSNHSKLDMRRVHSPGDSNDEIAKHESAQFSQDYLESMRIKTSDINTSLAEQVHIFAQYFIELAQISCFHTICDLAVLGFKPVFVCTM